MHRYLKLSGTVAAIALVIGVPTAAGVPTVCAPGGPWTQTWNSALDHGQPVGPFTNQTLRMVVHTSVGGSQLRLDLSNEFASSAVTFAHVSVAQQLNGAQAAGAPAVATFGGATSVTMAAGAETTSDPISFPTTAGERLLVSLYIPSTVSVTSANLHTYSGETEYNIVGTDAATMQNPPVSNTFSFTSYLNGVDVDATSADTVVAVGDSITDLANIAADSDTRWPDYLGRRTPLAVVDQGISGNRVTADGGSSGGLSLQHRWQHDVLSVPGVRSVIDADGVNDLRNGVGASALESAQAGLVASAHAAGLRILLSTITPCAGDSLCTASFETQRQAYNAWVRSGASGADGVADSDAAVANGAALAGIYGGPLHPNAAGMESMAGVIDVSKL